MRSFVSGVCCVVVGLEVLIGVPLAVCLAFFAVAQGGGPVTNTYAATIPPPSYVAPPNFAPPPMSVTVPASLPPSIATAPVLSVDAPPSKPVAVAEPVDPEIEAIAETQERIGSVVAGTVLDAAAASNRADTVQALRQVAAESAAAIEPPQSEGANTDARAQVETLCHARPDAAIAQLQGSVEHLYGVAGTHEKEGRFDRADQVRDLARRIRDEIVRLGREGSLRHEPLITQPAPNDAEPTRAASEPQSSSY